MDPALLEFLKWFGAVAFGVGSAWMALKASIKNLSETVATHERTIDDHEKRFYDQLKAIGDLEKDNLRLKAEEIAELKNELVRIRALSEAMQQDLNERANAAEKLERKFDRATEKTDRNNAWQNETMMAIAARTGATRKDSNEYRAAAAPRHDERAEPESDAPPKPMRPRLPTLRGTDEK